MKHKVKAFPLVSPIYDFLWQRKKTLKRIRRNQKKAYQRWKFKVDLLLPIYSIKFFHRKTAFLVLTPDYDNIGDHAIFLAEKEMLHSNQINFYEVPLQTCRELFQFHKLSVFNGREILITGGGYLGTLWQEPNALVCLMIAGNPQSKIIVLPNTVYYEETSTGKELFQESVTLYNHHLDLTVFLREKVSYEKVHGVYKRVLLVPDMALSLPAYSAEEERKGCLFILRSDLEKTMLASQYEFLLRQVKELFAENVVVSDMCSGYEFGIEDRKREVEKKMQEFCRAELVITDRLHGMIFAAVTGTPCIVIESKSTKIRGCYEWIKDLNYIRLCDDLSSIRAIWEEIGGKEYVYDNSILLPLYDELIKTIKEL